MENFLLTSDFPERVILEYPPGNIEFSLALPENTRRYCIAAARYFKLGKKRAARKIFTEILKSAVPDSLAGRLKFLTITELAHLAAYLLDIKNLHEQPLVENVSQQAFDKSVERLLNKNR